MNATLLNGLFVLADLVDGGRDFPVERAADVEEDENDQSHDYYAEGDPCGGRCHFRLLFVFSIAWVLWLCQFW